MEGSKFEAKMTKPSKKEMKELMKYYKKNGGEVTKKQKKAWKKHLKEEY